MEFKSEVEFLKAYNPNNFDRLAVTTDILLFSVSDLLQDNYRKTNEKVMSILLVKRNTFPFKNKWCVPGGFLKVDEELDDCPKRILAEETNLHNIYMEQLCTFGSVNRDPRMRIVSTAYMALIDKNTLYEEINPNAKWFNIQFKENKAGAKLILTSGKEKIEIDIKKTLKEKTTKKYKYEIIKNDSIAFDHAEVIITGLERLRNKVEYTDIVFNMMPEYFTLGELQKVYEVILGKSLLIPAFRRVIAGKVEKTEKIQGGGGHRPSYLYKYKKS